MIRENIIYREAANRELSKSNIFEDYPSIPKEVSVSQVARETLESISPKSASEGQFRKLKRTKDFILIPAHHELSSRTLKMKMNEHQKLKLIGSKFDVLESGNLKLGDKALDAAHRREQREAALKRSKLVHK